VVSRGSPATYRVRGYVSAMFDRGKTSFAWVWDVYDADKRRALRITGEEPATTAKARRRDAWDVADEAVLRGMSKNGMERIAAFLNTPKEGPATAPEPTLPVLVAGRDDSPEAAGIVRVLGGSAEQAEPPREPKADAQKPAPNAASAKPSQDRRRSAAAAPATLDQ